MWQHVQFPHSSHHQSMGFWRKSIILYLYLYIQIMHLVALFIAPVISASLENKYYTHMAARATHVIINLKTVGIAVHIFNSTSRRRLILCLEFVYQKCFGPFYW